MIYFSTNKKSPVVNFREATILGQAPDKGLYFPERIPEFSENFLRNFSRLTPGEIAFEIIRPYVGDCIDETSLRQICSETVAFDFPLVRITPQIFSLELFHGPTLAFKDVGARFMSRCLAYFNRDNNREVTVLVATSGDTGSAVAHGFLGVKGVRVVILYPSGKVSAIQEMQLTTLGQNIIALEVNGTFDDCQSMVKNAFADTALREKIFLTSANSINIARWLPQQFYYLFAAQQWHEDAPPVICVPSGNFGNICAGLLAAKSGMPASHFVAACNSNDTFSQYWRTNRYEAKKAVPTISNAMDVGDPSNFVRLQMLYHNNYEKIVAHLSATTISDAATRETIARVHKQHHYLLDPHAAVAFASLEKYLMEHPSLSGYILGTAHPCKFADVVEETIGEKIALPAAIQSLLNADKRSVKIPADYAALKAFLIS